MTWVDEDGRVRSLTVGGPSNDQDCITIDENGVAWCDQEKGARQTARLLPSTYPYLVDHYAWLLAELRYQHSRCQDA